MEGTGRPREMRPSYQVDPGPSRRCTRRGRQRETRRTPLCGTAAGPAHSTLPAPQASFCTQEPQRPQILDKFKEKKDSRSKS